MIVRTTPGVFTLRRLRDVDAETILPEGQPTPAIHANLCRAARCLICAVRLVDWAVSGSGYLQHLVPELAEAYRDARGALPGLKAELIRARTGTGLPATLCVRGRSTTSAHLASLEVADAVLREVLVAVEVGCPVGWHCQGEPVELSPDDFREWDPSSVDRDILRVWHAETSIREVLPQFQDLVNWDALLAELCVEAVRLGELTGQEVAAVVAAHVAEPLAAPASASQPWREKDLDELANQPQAMIRYMMTRDEAPVSDVCREVWRQGKTPSYNAIKSCLRKANEFLEENNSSWVISRKDDVIIRFSPQT